MGMVIVFPALIVHIGGITLKG